MHIFNVNNAHRPPKRRILTLKLIGLLDVGFEGFSFAAPFSGPVRSDLRCWWLPVQMAGPMDLIASYNWLIRLIYVFQLTDCFDWFDCLMCLTAFSTSFWPGYVPQLPLKQGFEKIQFSFHLGGMSHLWLFSKFLFAFAMCLCWLVYVWFMFYLVVWFVVSVLRLLFRCCVCLFIYLCTWSSVCSFGYPDCVMCI